MTETTESKRNDWKGRAEAWSAENDRLQKELSDAALRIDGLEAQLAGAEQMIEALRKEAERARLQGMADVTGLLLRESKP